MFTGPIVFDIQFENECKVSLVFHYLVKSEK